jgi:hypothetical protein
LNAVPFCCSSFELPVLCESFYTAPWISIIPFPFAEILVAVVSPLIDQWNLKMQDQVIFHLFFGFNFFSNQLAFNNRIHILFNQRTLEIHLELSSLVKCCFIRRSAFAWGLAGNYCLFLE